MLGKYHKLFTERKEFIGDTPVIVNIGEWGEGDEEDTQTANILMLRYYLIL